MGESCSQQMALAARTDSEPTASGRPWLSVLALTPHQARKSATPAWRRCFGERGWEKQAHSYPKLIPASLSHSLSSSFFHPSNPPDSKPGAFRKCLLKTQKHQYGVYRPQNDNRVSEVYLYSTAGDASAPRFAF